MSAGNGKTISMKAIMKEADAKGYSPLYVRSFRSWKGDEGAMVDVFSHARLNSPCVMVLEDLDSLINPNNRSFFLNQLRLRFDAKVRSEIFPSCLVDILHR